MDKETLLSKLTNGMGEPNATTQVYESLGVSVRTLDAYAENLLPSITDDAQVTDTFINGHQSFLKAMGGQMRHEKAEFVKNYKPAPPVPPTPPTPPDENKELEALKASLDEIKSKLDGTQKKQNEEAMRSSVKDRAKDLKVHNQALWNDVANSEPITDGMDAATLEKAVKTAYENKLKAYFGDGAEPYGGNGGKGGGGDESAMKAKREAFAERMRKRGKLPKKEA